MGMSTLAEILNLRILYLLDYYIMSETLKYHHVTLTSIKYHNQCGGIQLK